MRAYLLLALLASWIFSCTSPAPDTNTVSDDPKQEPQVVARVEFYSGLRPGGLTDTLAGRLVGEGYSWSEGPVWMEDQQALLFTDVPNNIIYRYKEAEGVTPWLQPSGFTGDSTSSPEPGANGLFLTDGGELLLCQQGDRQIARLASSLENPRPEFTALTSNFQGKRYNSPNDLIRDSKGRIFFTDPPFGLQGQDESAEKELDFNGVFALDSAGGVALVCSELARPNGLCLSPNEDTLFVTNSQAGALCVYALPADGARWPAIPLRIVDLTDRADPLPGMPDGIKLHPDGSLWFTGPGGIYIASRKGRLLAHIHLEGASSNLAFTADHRFLFVTNGSRVLRFGLTRGGGE